MEDWFKCPKASHLLTVELLLERGRQWDDAHCKADLAYFARLEDLKTGSRPSRRRLQVRWMRSDHYVRSLISQEQPKTTPTASQKHPKPTRSNGDNGDKISQNHPNLLPNTSQTPPPARLAQEKRIEKEKINIVWAVWRKHHSRCGARVPKDVRKLIKALLDDEREVDQIGHMIDWCHAPNNWWGENKRLQAGTILKMEKSSDRIAQGLDWHTSGRPDIVAESESGSPSKAPEAWSYVIGEMRSRSTPPQGLDNPGRFRLRAGLEACGGFDDVLNMNEFELSRMRAGFLAAFKNAQPPSDS